MKFSGRRLIRIIAALYLAITAVLFIFFYGIAVGTFKTPPYPLFIKILQAIGSATSQFEELAVRMNIETKKLPLHYMRISHDFPQPVNLEGQSENGINLVTRVAKGSELAVEIVDMGGNVLHSWNVDWFRVWPDATHVPDLLKPKAKPGTHIHGALVLENGELIYNYEHLGLVKLSRSGDVIWRLPYQTHHSIHRHGDGNLWVSGQKLMTEPDPHYPHRKTPFDKYTILEINPDDGAVVHEWGVEDILYQNGYGSLLDLVPVPPTELTQVLDDRLHLNDVEPFPLDMEEGFFQQGDVLVSLRNVSTVFVFNQDTGKIKYITTGRFAQQHDPDFLDGNRISVFDNNWKVAKPGVPVYSRIVIINAPTSEMEVVYEGGAGKNFFTPFMGKHQWLANGNILITEAMFGRAFEVNPEGDIVWQYVNKVGDDLVALVEEVTRLPLNYGGFAAGEQGRGDSR
jgi:hypothetical protein